MGGTGVIDSFLEVFTRYIDSGFGLLSGEVAFLATTLAAIDITLAAIFWSWAADEDIIARLAKKTLFVGVFAYLIGNWNSLARIIFESFSGLGLKASGSSMSAADFLSPGRVAQVGIDAGRPILDSISGLMGYISFFENFVQIVVLLFAWIVVLLAFFILAIQLFVTLIEFKLTTLAGFVLIPFGLFGKTAFAAERVLGNVISSGVKVLVLAVIVGIGSTLFSQFTSGFGGNQPTIENAMAMVLAALSLLGLGIYVPVLPMASFPEVRSLALAPQSEPDLSRVAWLRRARLVPGSLQVPQAARLQARPAAVRQSQPVPLPPIAPVESRAPCKRVALLWQVQRVARRPQAPSMLPPTRLLQVILRRGRCASSARKLSAMVHPQQRMLFAPPITVAAGLPSIFPRESVDAQTLPQRRWLRA
jgi:P-type conjugative transfer protein TrbL